MKTGRIDARVLCRVLTLALRAPSGDNCQPWRFVFDGQRLEILHVAERSRHGLNPHGAATALALGALITSLELAASTEGLRVQTTLEAPAPLGERLAVARFLPSDGVEDPLARQLQRRAVDRRPYRGGAPSPALLAAISAESSVASAGAGARASVILRPDPALMDWMISVDPYALRHRALYRDVLRWIRFSQAEIEATRDGIPWSAMGLRLPALPGLRAVNADWVPTALAVTGGWRAWAAWTGRLVRSSAGLIAFGVAEPGWAPLVESGRLAMSCWLRLVEAGFVAQPMTAQSTPVYDLAHGGLPAGTRPEFLARYAEGRAVLNRASGVDAGRWPVWLLRFGLPAPGPGPGPTLRLGLDGILETG